MDDIQEDIKKKNKLWIIIPIIIAIIVVAVFIYLDYRDKSKSVPEPNNNEQNEAYKPEPISPSDNPKRAMPINPDELAHYGCGGPQHLEGEVLKQPDSIWEIKKDGSLIEISLGKYRIIAPANTVFDITKLWLYFFSEKLSKRDDQIYALESSYMSRMRLIVNGYEKEIKLGGDEYMLIELDYPFGDLYPYDRLANLEYEFIIELKCKNIKNGECLNNQGRNLDYINDVEIISQLRLFAVGCQEFDKDIEIGARFKY